MLGTLVGGSRSLWSRVSLLAWGLGPGVTVRVFMGTDRASSARVGHKTGVGKLFQKWEYNFFLPGIGLTVVKFFLLFLADFHLHFPC